MDVKIQMQAMAEVLRAQIAGQLQQSNTAAVQTGDVTISDAELQAAVQELAAFNARLSTTSSGLGATPVSLPEIQSPGDMGSLSTADLLLLLRAEQRKTTELLVKVTSEAIAAQQKDIDAKKLETDAKLDEAKEKMDKAETWQKAIKWAGIALTVISVAATIFTMGAAAPLLIGAMVLLAAASTVPISDGKTAEDMLTDQVSKLLQALGMDEETADKFAGYWMMAVNLAASIALGGAAMQGTTKAVEEVAEETAEQVAEKVAKELSEAAGEEAAKVVAKEGTGMAADVGADVAKETVEEAAVEVAEDGAEVLAKEGTGKAAELGEKSSMDAIEDVGGAVENNVDDLAGATENLGEASQADLGSMAVKSEEAVDVVDDALEQVDDLAAKGSQNSNAPNSNGSESSASVKSGADDEIGNVDDAANDSTKTAKAQEGTDVKSEADAKVNDDQELKEALKKELKDEVTQNTFAKAGKVMQQFAMAGDVAKSGAGIAETVYEYQANMANADVKELRALIEYLQQILQADADFIQVLTDIQAKLDAGASEVVNNEFRANEARTQEMFG